MDERLLKYIKSGDFTAFYKTKEWLAKREEILERDNYECQRCKEEGLYEKAECVHHIKHLKEHPELALEDDNLISLSSRCHNKEHPEKLKVQESVLSFTNEERWE